MQSQIRVVRAENEVALVSSHGGKALAFLLAIEIIVLGVLNAQLATALPSLEILLLPILASVALVVWTALQIKPDYRISMNLATGEGRVERHSALTGGRTEASFPLAAVESLALLQAPQLGAGASGWREYVVALELQGGIRHVLSTRGSMLAYQSNVARFSHAAGIGTRIVRLS